jgi:predicted transcriptional regulator
MSHASNNPELQPTPDRVGVVELLAGLAERVCPQCGGRGKVCDPAQIGARLKREREKGGVTGREMARRMGYSAMYLCDLEHGRREWKSKLIASYLDALNGVFIERTI